MGKVLLGIYAMLLLVGCATHAASDVGTQEIKIVWHKTDQAWKDAVKLRGIRLEKALEINGFYFLENGICHVYAPDPPMQGDKYSVGQWGTLGHEVKHCFDGLFHR